MTELSDSTNNKASWKRIVIGFLILLGIGLPISIWYGYQDIMAERQTVEIPETVEDQDEKESSISQTDFFGSGDFTIQLKPVIPKRNVRIAEITHAGSGNFSIWALDENQEQQELLVSKIGNYSGKVLINPLRRTFTSAFEIVADGPWTVKLKDLKSLEEIRPGSATTGEGDEVFFYTSSPTIVSYSHEGQSNFNLWSHDLKNYRVIVEGIGTYSDEVPLRAGPIMIQVKSEGVWILELK